jgi:hypothetical protein
MHELWPNSPLARALRLLPLFLVLGASSGFAGEAGEPKPTGFSDRAQKWDKNGDGALDAEEKAELRSDLRERWDADGDGRLNRTERDAARAAGELPARPSQQSKRAEASRRKAMARQAKVDEFDADGDGEVTKEEAWNGINSGAAERAAAQRKANLDRYDADGDGTLNEEERLKARRENGLVRLNEIEPQDGAGSAPAN